MQVKNNDEIAALLAGTAFNDAGKPTRTLLVTGACGSGKTRFAEHALLEGLRQYGDNLAVMTVSNRVRADAISFRVIAHMGAVSQARPVTTLAALAFRGIAETRRKLKEPSPKLLNGAEQDALLRSVLAVHIKHARLGDECTTCRMLRDYFAVDTWADMVSDSLGSVGNIDNATTEALFTRSINSAFVVQLRDFLARLNELGVTVNRENEVLQQLDLHSQIGQRLNIQWRLAFALRYEYAKAVKKRYPGEFRLDSSRLFVEGVRALELMEKQDIPKLVVVDDFQDLTLAGLTFLEALERAGSRLVVIGNPDEAVQTFRGSYPEYLFAQVLSGALKARNVQLVLQPSTDKNGVSLLDTVVSRISLSIASDECNDTALPQRLWKEQIVEGSFPIAALPQESSTVQDGTVQTALYRSAGEELDDIVWRMKREHVINHRRWNDMALIAHDNATVRSFGERLRSDGVPVRYSSVTKALREELFVQGLFALIELAQLRHSLQQATHRVNNGSAVQPQPIQLPLPPLQMAQYVRSRVHTVMNSPLISVGGTSNTEGIPGRIAPVESAMQALGSLAGVLRDEANQDSDITNQGSNGVSSIISKLTQSSLRDDIENNNNNFSDHSNSDGQPYSAGQSSANSSSRLSRITDAWESLQAELRSNSTSQESARTSIVVDNQLLNPDSDSTQQNATLAFGIDALYILLILDGCEHESLYSGTALSSPGSASSATMETAESESIEGTVSTADILSTIESVSGFDQNTKAFCLVWKFVQELSQRLTALDLQEPKYVLSAAWDVCNVAQRWQRQALQNTREGRVANDRLDTAMRLFDYASSGTTHTDINGFIRQVSAMQIEADSLAKVAPIDDAVTLTTPAGSAGQHWPVVWIAQMQDGVWPNLAPRNTMFGGEDLVRIMLHGLSVPSENNRSSQMQERSASVLHAEQKGLLVAVSRSVEKVYLSAVYNDDSTPSDFLYEYIPELCDRGRDGEAETRQYTTVGESGGFTGLDLDPRGLVAAARSVLASNTASDNRAYDAAQALALFARYPQTAASPHEWAFEHTPITHRSDEAHSGCTVTLSPSAVDSIWSCPVCWMMQNRFAGPRPGSVASTFGSIIHHVVEQAALEGLDAVDFMGEFSLETRITAITERMLHIYEALKLDPATVREPENKFSAMRNDANARKVLGSVAQYFVMSNTDEYLKGNAKHFSIGTLDESRCEVPFSGLISLDDIVRMFNAIPGVQQLSVEQMYPILGQMVGGWPEAMTPDLSVRLSGRIDRQEFRTLSDGRKTVRLLDYKTGRLPETSLIFNDLQLVCYQLGLLFPENREDASNATVEPLPEITQSVLFHVSHKSAPAESYSPESLYQPALVVDGHLNNRGFQPRDHYRSMESLMKSSQNDFSEFTDVNKQAVQTLESLRGTHALWALHMIARVFYAAAASKSNSIIAHPTAEHVKRCKLQAVCPACAGESATVFEVRQA